RIDEMLWLEIELTYYAAHRSISAATPGRGAFEDKLVAAMFAAARLQFTKRKTAIAIKTENFLGGGDFEGVAANPVLNINVHRHSSSSVARPSIERTSTASHVRHEKTDAVERKKCHRHRNSANFRKVIVDSLDQPPVRG